MMKQTLTKLSQGYAAALIRHLKQGRQSSLRPARVFGRRAAALGLETLDVARIHEAALASLETTHHCIGIIQQAELFFAEAIIPVEKALRAPRKANAQLTQLNRSLGWRIVDLAASNRFLKQGLIQHKAAEKDLQKSGKHNTQLLAESRQLQQRLRQLTHRIIAASEDERTKISRELHDEIAQTLLGINVRLLTLKNEATLNKEDFKKAIAGTQRLVRQSIRSINRFARELDIHEAT
jgi:signal transduction histidine kinase